MSPAPVDATFRAGSEADLPALLPLVQALWEHERIPFAAAEVERSLRELLQSPGLGRVFIVEHDAQPVGYAILGFGFSLEYGGRDAMLDELYLVPAHRAAGLGGRVMDLLEAECRRLGIRALHLEVDRSNAAGRALYARRGFAGQDRLLLTRWIDGRSPSSARAR